MKLTYRGTQYDYNPPAVEATYGTSVGKYRGLDVRFRNPAKPVVMSSNLDLKYRGAAYATDATPAAATVVAPVATVVPTHSDEMARTLMMQQHRNGQRRQQVMLSRLATEVGLTANISQYWTHLQGKKIHPSF